MNRDNINFANNNYSINNNSNFSSEIPRLDYIKDYSTLNSIHLTSGIYNNFNIEENKELTKMKILVLQKEIKNVIENPDYNLNFQLIHMKCYNLNQNGNQFEFFDLLNECLLNKIKNYAVELIEFNMFLEKNHQVQINKNEDDLSQLNSHLTNNYKNITSNTRNYKANNLIAKEFLNCFIEKYEEYKKICLKISETINILDIKSFYLEKFKIKDEEIFDHFNPTEKIHQSEISKFSFIFKILFSLFFENLIFDERIQKLIFDSFFSSFEKLRKNFADYIAYNKEIEDYISVNDKNKNLKKNEYSNINKDNFGESEEASLEINKENAILSNLKLNENNFEINKEKKNLVEKFQISNFANLKKNDPILKIKGILHKKNMLENKKLSSQNNNDRSKLIELEANIKTSKKGKKVKIPLPQKIKAIFNILNDFFVLKIMLSKAKLDSFLLNFDERFINETKTFYQTYCKTYLENIKKNEDSSSYKCPNNLDKKINNTNKSNNKKEKFSHFDISILNARSDNESPIEHINRNDKDNKNECKNNLINLDFINNFTSNIKEDKIFINKKFSKENINKISSDTNYKNYNTYCGESEILDDSNFLLKYEVNQKSIKISNENKSKFTVQKKNKIKKIKYKKFPVSIEGFILEITQLISLDSDLTSDYDKKEEILILILQLCLNENEEIFASGLRKFIDKSDLSMIKFLFKIYSQNEAYKIKFNNILNQNLTKILSDLEKNYAIINKFNKVEYVNFLFFVEEIFEIKKKFYQILKESLNSFSRSELIIKTSLEKIVNKNFDFMENFVKLIHDEIKIAIKNKSPCRLKDFQEKFLSIFKLLNEKDLFEVEYRKYLSKRLLRNSSMVRETEFEFFEILKKESGNIYTRKIEKILDEISVSYDLNVEYSNKYEGNINRLIVSNTNKKNEVEVVDCNLNLKKTEKSDSNNNSKKNSKNFNNFFSKDQDKLVNGFFSSISKGNEEDKNSLNTIIKNFAKGNHTSNLQNCLNTNKKDYLENNNFLQNNAISSDMYLHNDNINSNYNYSNSSIIPNNSGNHKGIAKNKFSLNTSLFNNNNHLNNRLSPKTGDNNIIENCCHSIKDNKSFKPCEKKSKIIDINVKVVSSDSWLLENINIKNNKRLNISEIKKNENFSLPKILDKYIENFTEFYSKKFKNRQLKWINEYSYSFIDMKAKNGRVYNILASNYQMSFLCIFNKIKSPEEIPFKEILALLRVDSKDNQKFLQTFKSHILPIFESNILLIKHKEKQEINDIEDNDLIYYNRNFYQEDCKIKLLNCIVEKKEILIAEEKKEIEINHFVLEDRKHQLDAIIMRTLKFNKIIEFEKLIFLINEEIKKFFVPEIKFIKLRLENLIDRNFIKRSENNSNCYEYL